MTETRMELRSCYIEGVNILENTYGRREAEAIVMRLLEDHYGISREQLYMGSRCTFIRSFRSAIRKIAVGCPLQHITGFQEFFGRRFSVSGSVLIPRPETEELVDAVIKKWKGKKVDVLDIGTGSGAIAVSLALGLCGSRVTGIDVSRRALKVARKNAEALGAGVEFLAMDFLKESQRLDGRTWDIVISNPPYIPKGERDALPSNVRGHDPGRALYVSDKRPLVFYERTSLYAFKTLNKNGMVYFEINEKFGRETAEIVRSAGFEDVQLRQDMMGKDRMVWGRKL